MKLYTKYLKLHDANLLGPGERLYDVINYWKVSARNGYILTLYRR